MPRRSTSPKWSSGCIPMSRKPPEPRPPPRQPPWRSRSRHHPARPAHQQPAGARGKSGRHQRPARIHRKARRAGQGLRQHPRGISAQCRRHQAGRNPAWPADRRGARANRHGGRSRAPRGAAARTGAESSQIQADEATNSLIISAPDAVFNNLRAVIEKLDVRRAQVFVEALIAEITTDKASQLGVQWFVGDQKKRRRARRGHQLSRLRSAALSAPPPIPTTLAGAGGLSLGFLGETITRGRHGRYADSARWRGRWRKRTSATSCPRRTC